jgi:hypothetical protein
MENGNKSINRSRFLRQAVLIGICVVSAILYFLFEGSELDEGPPYSTLAEAIKEANEVGIGTVHLEGPPSAEVRTYGTWTVIYTAGKTGVKPGGGIRIGVRHLTSLWTKLQNSNPEDDGYLSVKSPDNIPITVNAECGTFYEQFVYDYFPFNNIVEIIVDQPGLKPGQTLRVTYGDTSGGSAGMSVQPFDEEKYIFKTFVDALGNNDFLPIEKNPTIRIRPGKPNRLAVILKSNAVKGEQTVCVVRAEDQFGNPAEEYKRTVKLSSSDASAILPPSYTFKKSDKGVHQFDNIVFNAGGIQTLSVTDGQFQAQSNPVSVTETHTGLLLLWGDLHGHTAFSDGRGTTEEYYDFARRVAALDFCATSDHAFMLTDKMWRESKLATNEANEPGTFITFNGYEWSGMSEVGGDHNVYWLDDDPPIYRSTLFYSPRNLQMDHDTNDKTPHIQQLYAALEKRMKNKNVFCIPGRGGRGANPKWHNPKFERLVEAYCEHFRSEEWANEFLQKGYRLGLMASGDDHYGNPGYGYLHPDRQKLVGEGLIAVLAEQNTRKSIFTAMYDRHCYATTGDRIILDFRADGHIMGSEYTATKPPEIQVKAVGTTDIRLIEIKKNSKIVFSVGPFKRTEEIRWLDPDFQVGQSCYYNVRVLQNNDEEALSSPIWVKSVVQ